MFDYTKYLPFNELAKQRKQALDENRIIAHHEDYDKMVACGSVALLGGNGIKVVSCKGDLMKKGKLIATGEIAKAMMIKDGKWKGW